jgi:hypothetical protein
MQHASLQERVNFANQEMARLLVGYAGSPENLVRCVFNESGAEAAVRVGRHLKLKDNILRRWLTSWSKHSCS